MKVLAFDIDGTLTESRQPLTSGMVDLLMKLSDNHILVFLTGGSINLITHQIISPMIKYSDKPLPLMHLFPTSGAEYYVNDYEGNLEKKYSYQLSTWDTVQIYSLIRDIIIEKNILPITNYEDMVDNRGSQINFSLTGREADLEYKIGFDPDMSFRKEIVEEYEMFLPDNIQVSIGGTSSLDFTIKGVDKGTALGNLLKELNLLAYDCTFFGDRLQEGGNDHSVVGVCKVVQVTDPDDTRDYLLSLLSNNERFK